MKTIYYNFFTKRIYKINNNIYKFDKFIVKIDEFKFKTELEYSNDSIKDNELHTLNNYFSACYFVSNCDIRKSVKMFLKTYLEELKKYRVKK